LFWLRNISIGHYFFRQQSVFFVTAIRIFRASLVLFLDIGKKSGKGYKKSFFSLYFAVVSPVDMSKIVPKK
jgi:hypothetical protein